MTRDDGMTVSIVPTKMRGPVKTTPVCVMVLAEYQDNGDGTYSACIPAMKSGVHTDDTMENALQRAIAAVSYGPMPTVGF